MPATGCPHGFKVTISYNRNDNYLHFTNDSLIFIEQRRVFRKRMPSYESQGKFDI